MKINCCMTTSPRQKPNIRESLQSLREAGMPDPIVSNDRLKIGPWPNTIRAIEMALETDCDAVFFCQDDVLFARGLHQYIQKTGWPAEPETIGGVSFYTPHVVQIEDRPTTNGWFKLRRYEGPLPIPRHEFLKDELPRRCYGLLAVLIPRHSAEKLVHSPPRPKERLKADFWFGKHCQDRRLDYWLHSPSFCEHIGVTSTVHVSKDGVSLGLDVHRRAKHWVRDVSWLEEKCDA